VNPSLNTASSPLIPEAQRRPGDDPIFALNAAAQARAAKGETVINSTLGALMEDDGHLAILPSVTDALAAVAGERAAAYAPIAGDPAFLQAVIRDLFGGTGLEAQAVAVATPGGTGAVHHAIVNFLEPGESLLTTSYYWSPYQIMADHTRRGVETFNMFGAHGRLDTPAFETALFGLLERQERALVILNSPCHNPTGYSLDETEWKEVVRILKAGSERGSVAFLNDYAYAKFGGPGADDWIEHVKDLGADVPLLVAWTVSKSFAQYGARIGALVAVHPDEAERKRIFNALSYSCRGTWSNCNHLGLLAITEMLSNPELKRRSDEEREHLRTMLSERVEVFKEHARRAGLEFPRYEGGFFVAVFTPDPALTSARAQEDGVFVVPIQGAVRVALCSTPAKDVPKLVEAVAAGVEAARG
jgi:aromatic-amino-acid transaminase